MPTPTKEFPVMFTEGWDTRGSTVGEPVRPVQMSNAWMSCDDRGAIESMEGEGSFIDWSAHTTQMILAISVGTNQTGKDISVGSDEDVEEGAIGIVGVSQYGEVLANNYDTSGISNISLTGEHGGDQWSFPGIVKMGDKFHIFQGQDEDVRKGQVTAIGSSAIEDISLPRPDTGGGNVYVTENAGGDNNVKGLVRYWISQVQGTKEGALSPQLRRDDDIPYHLHFVKEGSTPDNLNFGNNFDIADASTDDWSAEFLFRMSSAPSSQMMVMCKREGIDVADDGWSFHVADTGGIHFNISDGTTEYDANTPDVCDGNWHRISAAFDAALEEMKIWVDDDLKATTDTSSVSLTSGSSNVFAAIVGSDVNLTLPWTGDITDIRFYGATAITDPDVDGDLYTRIMVPGSKTGLTGYYRCNEGTGLTVEDTSGTADGSMNTLYAAEWVSNEEFGEAAIDAEDGSRVDIVFSDSETHGKKYRIYRSQKDGANPYYVATFTPDSGAYTYTDDTPDRTFTTTTSGTSTTTDGLGDLPYLHGDEPPENGRAAVGHANHVFVAKGNRLYWTDITNDESYWTADNGNWINVNPDDGDTITALASDYDGIVIFKSNHIYRLNGRRPEEFTLRPLVPGTSNPVSLGAPNINAVCTTPQGIAFYWNRKVFILSGNNITRISDPIAEQLNSDNLQLSDTNDDNIEWYNASVGYWAGKEQLWFSIGSNSKAGNRTYIYDLINRMWIGRRERGYRSAQSVRSMGSWRADLADEEFVGASADEAGWVVRCLNTSATKFQNSPTEAYDSSVELSPFYGGNLNNLKRFLWVDVIYGVGLRPLGSGAEQFEVQWWVDSDEAAETAVTVSTDPTLLGIASTATIHTARVNINEVGKSLHVKFENEMDLNGKWKVYGLVYGYQDLPSISR